MKKLFFVITTIVVCLTTFRYQPKTDVESYEIQPFSIITQPDSISCGPVSATMVLQKYGKNVTLEEVRKITKTDWITIRGQKIGTTLPDFLMKSMNNFGVQVTKKSNCTLNDLKYYISQNRPPIIIVRTKKFTSHYVVVIGYNKDNFILANPNGEKEEIKNDILYSAWSFTTDKEGNPVIGTCPLCFGTGNILGINLNPLTFCELCNGTGKMLDITALVHIWADVYPNTMIIPKEPCK